MGVGMLVLGRLIARDQDQALSKVWVSNSIIHGPGSPSLTSILQSFLEHVEQFSNFGSGALITQVLHYTTPWHAIVKAGMARSPCSSTLHKGPVGGCAAWEPRLHGGLPEGIHSYPGTTGRSTQYHLGP